MPNATQARYLDVPPSAATARGTLVLLHAFPLNARMWEPQLELAARGWRIVAPHLRGFDEGTADPPVRTVDDYADDVLDLLDRLAIADPVLGGLSLGGYVTFAMLRRRPGLARALVLADTRSQADTPDAVAGRRRMLERLNEQGPAAVVEELLPKLVGASTMSGAPDRVARVRALAQSAPAAAIAGALHALMTRPDSTPLLGSIDRPTLVVVGEEDTLTPPALAGELQGRIGGAELAVIPRAGHLTNLEQPAAFNAAVGGFLDRL